MRSGRAGGRHCGGYRRDWRHGGLRRAAGLCLYRALDGPNVYSNAPPGLFWAHGGLATAPLAYGSFCREQTFESARTNSNNWGDNSRHGATLSMGSYRL